ncbi:MAG: hypothetical protein EOP87_04025 [Verrucomicrobiaceae bacterium]|nr:MAG: hypothetical protein EOP87_04025 [Verrucomicrobiaceae bacterium]
MAADFFRAGNTPGPQHFPMTKGKWLMGFGVFLFVCGAAAYLSNPAQPPTPLVAGALSGGLMAMLGVLADKGSKWALTSGIMLTIVLLMLALAMAMQHWLLVFQGGRDLLTPLLDTALLLAASAALWGLKRKA